MVGTGTVVQPGTRAVQTSFAFPAGSQYVFAVDYTGLIPLLDVAVTYFRAFRLANGTLIYDLQAIRLHYTSDRLLWDLASFAPLDIIMAAYAVHHHPYVSFVRLPRMLSLYSVWYKRGLNFSVGAESSMSVAILRLLIFTAVITHVFACVWWYIGSWHMLDVRLLSSVLLPTATTVDSATFLNASITLMPCICCDSCEVFQTSNSSVQVEDHKVVGFEPHDDPHEKESHWIYYYDGLGRKYIADYHYAHVGIQYLFSYYWCASTLTTAGRIGTVTPKNTAELMFTILSMLFTSVFYGYVMGEITNLVMSNDDALVQKRQKFGLVQVLSCRTVL